MQEVLFLNGFVCLYMVTYVNMYRGIIENSVALAKMKWWAKISAVMISDDS